MLTAFSINLFQFIMLMDLYFVFVFGQQRAVSATSIIIIFIVQLLVNKTGDRYKDSFINFRTYGKTKKRKIKKQSTFFTTLSYLVSSLCFLVSPLRS